jgi:hypothetical protein
MWLVNRAIETLVDNAQKQETGSMQGVEEKTTVDQFDLNNITNNQLLFQVMSQIILKSAELYGFTPELANLKKEIIRDDGHPKPSHEIIEVMKEVYNNDLSFKHKLLPQTWCSCLFSKAKDTPALQKVHKLLETFCDQNKAIKSLLAPEVPIFQ